MNKSSMPLLALTLAILAAATLVAQPADTAVEPFGFHRGMTQKAIIDLVGGKAVVPNKTASASELLRLNTAPQPHPAFEEYMLYFSPSEGLLKIHAIGVTIRTSVYGDEIKTAFATICDALTSKYGTPKGGIYDYLKIGSIWNEPRDWMMGLLKKERDLFATWDWSNGSCGITLSSTALSDESAYFTLDYEFTGWDKYVDSKEAKQNNVF